MRLRRGIAVLCAVLLNAGGDWLATVLPVPLYLDTTGTILAGALTGAGLTGVVVAISTGLFTLMHPGTHVLHLAVPQVVVGIVTIWSSKKDFLRSPWVAAPVGASAGVGVALAAVSLAWIGDLRFADSSDLERVLFLGAGARAATEVLDKALLFAGVSMVLTALPGPIRTLLSPARGSRPDPASEQSQ